MGLLSDHKILKKHGKKKQAKQQQKIYISLARSVQFRREQHRCVNQHQGVSGPSFLLLPLILFPGFLHTNFFCPSFPSQLSFSREFCACFLCLAGETAPKLTFALVTSSEVVLGGAAVGESSWERGCLQECNKQSSTGRVQKNDAVMYRK